MAPLFSYTLFRSVATVVREVLMAPLAGGSEFVPTSYSFSELLINILFGPFVKFVRFFGKETQDLSLDLFGVLFVAEPVSILSVQKATCHYHISHSPLDISDHGVPAWRFSHQ